MNHGQNTGGGENPNRATGNFKLNIDERDLATGNIDLPERRSQPPRPEYSVNKAYLTEKERRAALAGEVAAKLHNAFLTRQIGTEHDVLFEQTEKGYFTGHTMNYVKVYCDAADLRNEIRRVRVTKLFEDGVLAELI